MQVASYVHYVERCLTLSSWMEPLWPSGKGMQLDIEYNDIIDIPTSNIPISPITLHI